jgi:hypothetical protein
MVTLSRRSARLLLIPLAALLAAACEHNLGPTTGGGGGGPGPGPSLGTASTYGILAATAVTCVSAGVIEADLGLSPNTASSITGFPPCTITGTQHAADAVAAQAKADFIVAYNALSPTNLTPCTPIVANLGGTTLTPGCYNSGSSVGVTGTVILDGQGNANARFVIQAGSSLTTAGSVALKNGTQAKNVWWWVGSDATLGTASFWRGNVLALGSITLNDDAHMIGRAFAQTGAITLGNRNFITLP